MKKDKKMMKEKKDQEGGGEIYSLSQATHFLNDLRRKHHLFPF